MPTIVLVLWSLLLVAVVALLPFIVIGLHRAWFASRGIDRYFAEMLTAAEGIAINTKEVQQLDATIETATTMLTVAGGIHEKAETLKATLAERAGVVDGVAR